MNWAFVLGIIVAIAIIAYAAPLLLLWALNALGLVVAYTFKTWLAALVILCLFTVRSAK